MGKPVDDQSGQSRLLLNFSAAGSDMQREDGGFWRPEWVGPLFWTCWFILDAAFFCVLMGYGGDLPLFETITAGNSPVDLCVTWLVLGSIAALSLSSAYLTLWLLHVFIGGDEAAVHTMERAASRGVFWLLCRVIVICIILGVYGAAFFLPCGPAWAIAVEACIFGYSLVAGACYFRNIRYS